MSWVSPEEQVHVAQRDPLVLGPGLRIVPRLEARHWMAWMARSAAGGWQHDLQIGRADGTETRRLVRLTGFEQVQGGFVWSGDGASLWLGGPSLRRVDVATGETAVVVAHEEGVWYWLPISASPDGRFILAIERRNIDQRKRSASRLCRINASTGVFDVLLGDVKGKVRASCASVSWQRSLVAAMRVGRPVPSLALLPLDDLCAVRPLLDVPNHVEGISLSRSADAVALDGWSELSIVPVEGGPPRTLFGPMSRSAWCPSGATLAWIREQRELLLLPTDGSTDARSLVVCRSLARAPYHIRIDGKPRWSPDGRLLWFRLAARDWVDLHLGLSPDGWYTHWKTHRRRLALEHGTRTFDPGGRQGELYAVYPIEGVVDLERMEVSFRDQSNVVWSPAGPLP